MAANNDFDGLFAQLKNMSAQLKKTKSNNTHLKLDVKQNKSFLKLNSLLEKSAQSLVCGPDCQKEKKTDTLKQKYLEAETNIQTAPIILEESRKNYYVFAKGEPYYDNMREKELTDKAKHLAGQIFDEFTQEIKHCEMLNSYYQGTRINQEHMDELYASYLEKLVELRNKSQGTRGDVLTNQRKTFYQNEETTSLEKWSKLWHVIYFFLVFLFSICLVFKTPEKTVKTIIPIFIKIGLLVAYPFVSYRFIQWLWNWIRFFISLFPKNVYNSL